MLNPGLYALSDRAITTALNEAQTPIVDLDGVTAVSIQGPARLRLGRHDGEGLRPDLARPGRDLD